MSLRWKPGTRFYWTPPRVFALAAEIEEGYEIEVIAENLTRRFGYRVTPAGIEHARQSNGLRSITDAGYTALSLARLMGTDQRAPIRWMATGLLSGKRGLRRSRTRQYHITHEALATFLRNPESWYLWDPERITDPGIRRWTRNMRGDLRFLSHQEVADRFCVTRHAVDMWVNRGQIKAQPNGKIASTDLDGFVPPNQRVRRERTNRIYTQRDDALIDMRRRAGWSWSRIAQLLDRHPASVCNRYHRLIAKGIIEP